MTDPKAATPWIDERLAALPAAQRAALQALRATIATAAPEAEETISYSMPAFRYHGRALVSYDGFKTHCSFFPMGSAEIAAYRDELVDFATTKGTLRFTPEHPIPTDLVARIVHDRMAAIDRALAASAERRRANASPRPR